MHAGLDVRGKSGPEDSARVPVHSVPFASRKYNFGSNASGTQPEASKSSSTSYVTAFSAQSLRGVRTRSEGERGWAEAAGGAPSVTSGTSTAVIANVPTAFCLRIVPGRAGRA